MSIIINTSKIYFGSCSWNYDSWVGLVYPKKESSSVDYLAEYAQHYRSAEIDSWFYHIPRKEEVEAYKKAVPADFKFTCKVPANLCLTHLRTKSGATDLVPNPNFLSPDYWYQFLDVITPLVDQISGFMFEFEYLNQRKMPSVTPFLEHLDNFFAHVPSGLPYALEPRNTAFLQPDYFKFLQSKNLIHVLSEKQWMPPITEVYSAFKSYWRETVIIRLLGGDRKGIEDKTGQKWDQIIEPQEGLSAITEMLSELVNTKTVFVNVNNHYEGSAPLTINRIREKIKP